VPSSVSLHSDNSQLPYRGIPYRGKPYTDKVCNMGRERQRKTFSDVNALNVPCHAMPCHARGRAIAYARAEAERCVIEAGTYPAVLHTHTREGKGVGEELGTNSEQRDEHGNGYGYGYGYGSGKTGTGFDNDNSPIRRSSTSSPFVWPCPHCPTVCRRQESPPGTRAMDVIICV